MRILMDAKNMLGTPFSVEIKDSPYEGDDGGLSSRTAKMLPPLSSTLAVKVTQFSCGTLIVAASMHHQVADLGGFLEFLELWAQITRGDSIDFTNIPDDWTRHPGRFFPSSFDISTESTLSPFKLNSAPATGQPAFSPLMASSVSKWRFTKTSLEKLKNDLSPIASQKYKSGLWISTGDSLTALACGAIVRARSHANVPRFQGRSSLESEMEIIGMAANCRDRCSLGLKASGRYFGNFVTFCMAPVSRSNLLSPVSDSASRVAVAIRDNLSYECSPRAIARKIEYIEAQNIKLHGLTVDIGLSNWCQFDLKGPKLDFGWGKPFRTTDGGNVYPPGACVMMKDYDSEDVVVTISVEEEGEEVVRADPLLNKYAELVTA
ncbi:hypothetical protein KVV02_007461 [Mortierella alpina]|uniref:Transferase n=1 Tax=Mortierella alpina TaxID=64518 RepID=A0A9P7ZX17_MORAP|nr:hypothetical protein KVV02_007461 [Mortierella alpina]